MNRYAYTVWSLIQHDPIFQQDNAPAATEPNGKAPSAESQVEIESQEPVDEVEDEEADPEEASEDDHEDEPNAGEDSEPLDVKLERITLNHAPSTSAEPATPQTDALPQLSQANNGSIYDDPEDEDDGEGEWITPSNVALHKSRALHLVPDETGKRKGKPAAQIRVGCMTADFAMQNVLLQMGLSLVGVEGRKIDRVKTWVLRCHACFK